jgi:membrane-associated phospholipid phosphatase
MDSPLLSDALIRSRDGIVGFWQNPVPANTPRSLAFDDPANMERWSPWVRAGAIDLDMVSRLGFTAEAAGANPRRLFVWHLEVPAPVGANPPVPVYRRLVAMARPPRRVFRRQLRFVAYYADLRPDRQSEILAQMGGGLSFLSSVAYLHPDRTPYTLELLAAVLRLAIVVHLRLKQGLACRRPIEFSAQIQPMILTPAHGTLPSGHATEAFAAAIVLWNLLRASGRAVYAEPQWRIQLLRLAARIAINRTVAGVHFPADSAAGAVLGLTLGRYFVDRCSGAMAYTDADFDGTQYPRDQDFVWRDLYDPNVEALRATAYSGPGAGQALDPARQSGLLSWLWNRAVAEWS